MTARPDITAIDLAGTWQLSTLEGSHSTPMQVPGDVHSALLSAGIIPDPYAGRNERDVQWVAEVAWAIVQFDWFRSACYEQKLTNRFRFDYTRGFPYGLEKGGRRA